MQLRTVAIVLQTCFCIAIFYLIVNLVIRQCYLCYIDVAKFERCYKIFLAVRMRP